MAPTFFPELLEVPGDKCDRDILKKHLGDILKVDAGTPDVHFDVDGPKVLEHI